MPVTIELPDDLAEVLRLQAEAHGEDFNRYAVATLAEAAARDEPSWDDHVWWNSLTEPEQVAEIETLRRSMADADAGSLSPSDDVFARVRARRGAASSQ